MVLGDYGTADFRKYRTSLQYIYKCKRIRHRTQSGESSPGTESVTRQIRDMIQKRISRRERRDAVQGRTVLWIQRSVLLKRRQWKIILEDLDTWQKYSFIFYDEVGIGRAKRNDNYEKYLPLHEDGRVSKQHCVIIQRGDCLYLMDDGSKNGTYLNGILVDRPTEVQREDVIGVGETRLEILRILRESE